MLHAKICLTAFENSKPSFKAKKLQKKQVDMRKIERIICEALNFFSLQHEHVFSTSRKRELVTSRYMMFLYIKSRGFSSMDTGEVIKRDHSTVLYGIDVIKDLMDAYPEIKQGYEDFKNHLDKKLKL